MPGKMAVPSNVAAMAGLKPHKIEPGAKIARIMVGVDKSHLWCLVEGCAFYINVQGATTTIRERELKDFYRDHRKHRHPEYVGRTLYEFLLGEDVPRQNAMPTV